MLDSHPDLAIPPETGFLMSGQVLAAAKDRNLGARLMAAFPPDAPAWNDYHIDREVFLSAVQTLPESAGLPEVLRLFYACYIARQNKPRAGDKTPMYVAHMPTVAAILPEAHFIHIVRDGRDVALSWRETWFAPSRDVAELVGRWAAMIKSARAAAAAVNYLEVQYEDLVRSPEKILGSICDYIKIDFRPEMLQFYLRSGDRLMEHKERKTLDGTLVVSSGDRFRQQWRTTLPAQDSRIGLWRTAMSAEDQERCLVAADGLLEAS